MTVVRLPRPPYPDLLGQEEKDRLEAQLEGERARELDRLAQRLYGTCAHSQSTFSAIDYFIFYTFPSIDITVQSADTCTHESKSDRPQTI